MESQTAPYRDELAVIKQQISGMAARKSVGTLPRIKEVPEQTVPQAVAPVAAPSAGDNENEKPVTGAAADTNTPSQVIEIKEVSEK